MEPSLSFPQYIISHKNTKGFIYDNTPLNISYITHNIIASSIPTNQTIPTLIKYFKHIHNNNIKIYSLCGGLPHDPFLFGNNIPYVLYPLIDHEAPSIQTLYTICTSN